MATQNDSRNSTDHLAALELRLSNERSRLASATSPKERELRAVWVKQIEKEIAKEREFTAINMTDDELMAALETQS